MAKRYAIIADTIPLEEVAQQCRAAGGTRVAVARHSRVVFADLTDDQVRVLSATLHVARLRELRPDDLRVPPEPASAPDGFSPQSLSMAAQFEQLRNLFSPPLTGATQTGARIAILDTGISPHETIGDRVIWEKDYTGSGSTLDEFDHGTGVASMLVQMAPGVKILNCKVLGPTGEGTAEAAVMAIEDLIDMVLTQDERYPTMVNMSLGTPDLGDPHDPLRRACRAAIHLGVPEEIPGPHQLLVVAAAGNAGPGPGTVSSPAVEQEVVAVGGLTTRGDFGVAEFSSRGPTLEGLTKPDIVFYAQDIVLASSAGPAAYKVRSGTSFSCPAMVGIAALAVEMGWRFMGSPVQVPGMSVPVTPEPAWTVEDLFAVLPLVCVKPAGTPIGKDNSYGYGMPFGELLLSVMQAQPVSTALQMVGNLMIPVLFLAMLSKMIPRQ